MGNRISAIIITKNEEKNIVNCIEALQWCEEILVIDNGSVDATCELAERLNARIVRAENRTFSELRNVGKDESHLDWLLYVDADERVTPKLSKAIESAVLMHQFQAYSLPRYNIHYGKWMQHGGWEKDTLIRLFQKESLLQWEGNVHEHAVIEGQIGLLTEPLVHLTHQNLVQGLRKSADWTPIEASAALQHGMPKMTFFRMLRGMLKEFFVRYIQKKGYKDGTEGAIESMVQAMNRFYVYEQIWEQQRKPSLNETYEKIDKEISNLWLNEKQ